MRFLVTEKLGPHKFKTPEGYLICTDAILSRTGKQEYKRCELFGDTCEDPDKIVNVERTDDEVFSDKAMASFENKAVCIEHPDHDVNAENHNELAVGFVRDIHKGEDNGKPVMMGTLVITDKDAVEAVESGEYKELSCGYDCDIDDNDEPCQRNIRGNHVALCKQGRAGIARIVDSVNDMAKLSAEESATLKAMIEGGAGKRLYERLSYNKPVSIHLTQEDKELLRWHRDENQYLTNEEKALLKKLVGDSKVKDSEYHQIDMTDPWGGTRSLIVKAFSFEEAKKKAEKFKPEWKFRAGYQASKDDVDWAKRRGLYVDNVNDLMFNRMTEEAKKLKEELGMYARQAGSHKSTGIVPYKTRQSGPQVKELNEAINEAIQQFQNGVRDKSAWNRLAIKLEAWEDDPEMTSIAKRAAKAIRKFEVFIGDGDMKDIQSTKAPGTDKIIYVMQSDIDKNLYFYIGKTFSMKEGAWGYTKFEMSGTTPEQLKAELSKNGWHQVTNGPARVIDMNDERLIKRTELNVGMNIRWKYHGEQYEGRIKRVEQKGSYTKIDYEDKRGIGASFAFENEPITTTDSWTEVEEENYKKANKPIGAKDEEYVQLPRGRFMVVTKTKEELEKEGYGYHHSDRGYSVYVKNNQAVAIKDSVKEKLFTIEFEKDGITHIHKVRANSIEDAISKVKDNGHKVVVFTNQVLNELGKNNSIGKYDRVVQAMRSLYSESLLPDNELKILIRKKVPEYIKKYVKE